MKMRALVICVCLALFGGCSMTDLLTVFQDRLLSATAMASFLGSYTLSQAGGTVISSGSLAMEQKGARYFVTFDYVTNDGKEGTYEGFFLLSHIPKTTSFKVGETPITFTSSRETILFSAPQVTESSDGQEHAYGNVVLIVKQEGSRLYFWLLLSDADVAKGRLTSSRGVLRSADVKAFLAEYADAYVLANEPVFVFTRR